MSNPEPSNIPLPPVPGGPPRRRLPLGLRLILFFALAVVVIFASILVILQNSAVGTRLAQFGLRGTTPVPRATMVVREVRGDWITWIDFYGVRIARGDTLLLAVDTRLRVRHDPRGIFAGYYDLARVELRGVTASSDVIDTTAQVATPDSLSLGDILRGRFYGGSEIRVRALTLTRGRWVPGAGAPDSVRGLDDVALTLRDGRIGGDRMSFLLERLALRRGAPDALSLEAAGSVRDGRAELTRLEFRTAASMLQGRGMIATGDERGAGITRLEVRADDSRLALSELRPFLPGLALDGVVRAHGALRGARLDSLDGTVAADTDGARFGAHAVGPTRLAARFKGGSADVVLGTVYEGATVTASGWVRPLDATPTYDLIARADRLPRRIEGVPAYEPYARRADFATTLRVRGEGYASARLAFEGSARGAGGTIELTGTAAAGDSLGWTVQRAVFQEFDVAQLLGQAEPSGITGTFTGSGDGRTLRGAVVVTDATYGEWHLERATADVRRGPDGRLQVSGGRFQHLTLDAPADEPAATTDASGTFRAEGRGTNLTAWFALEPSVVRGEQVESAEATVSLAGTQLHVDGRAASTAGRIELVAQARPFESPVPYTIERLRFENVDASAFGGASLPETDLSGTLAATGDGAGLGSGALVLGRSRVERFTLDGAEARFDFAGGRMRVDADVRTPGGTASLEVTGDTASYDATGAIPFGVLAHALGRDSLSSEGALRFTATGHGLTPRTARLDAQATGEGRIGDARVDSLALALRLADGIATVDTLLLYSNVAEAHGVGKLALFDTSAVIDSTEGLRFALATREVGPLEAILGIDTLAVANLLVEGRLYGPATNLAFDASGTVHSLAMDDLRVVGADFLATGTLDRAYRVDTGQAHLDLRNVQASGVRMRAGKLDVTLVERAPTFELTTDLDATHRVVLAGAARIDSATVHVTLNKADVTADSASWALVRPARFSVSRDRLVVDDFEGRSTKDGLVRAQGVIDRRGRQDFELELRSLGLDFLSAWMGRTNLGGSIDGTLALDGPAQAPQAKGDVTVSLRSDGEAAGILAAKMEWDGRRLGIDGAFNPPTGAPLTVAGHLPLAFSLAAATPVESTLAVRATSGDVDLRVRGEQVALASFAPFFDPGQVTALGGTLDVDIRLAGQSEAIAGSGNIAIIDGRAELPLLGVTYEQANLAAGLEGDRVLVREARLRSEKGTVTADGTLVIESLTRVVPDLHVVAADFEAVENKLMHVVASGDVKVTGTLTELVVRGKASVENSEFYLTRTTTVNTPGERDVQLTPADIHMMEAAFGPVTARKPDLTWQLYDASDLDIDIELQRNTWVRQRNAPRLAFEMSGNVVVKKRPHEEPELYGRIAPVPGHGYVEQFARRFDFSGGEVLLNGPMNSHDVDIQTTYKTASSGDSGGDDVVVRMDVTGKVDDLKLTLSSEPAMSPTEIVSYIATGQTRSEMAADPGTSTSATSLAAQTALAQVTGRVEDIAQESIGLDVVQIRQDAVQGATLVAGRYVSSRLYVGFRQPVQYQANDNTSTSTNYRTQVEVEYEAYQWLLMNLQGESSEINSFIRARRAY